MESRRNVHDVSAQAGGQFGADPTGSFCFFRVKVEDEIEDEDGNEVEDEGWSILFVWRERERGIRRDSRICFVPRFGGDLVRIVAYSWSGRLEGVGLGRERWGADVVWRDREVVVGKTPQWAEYISRFQCLK